MATRRTFTYFITEFVTNTIRRISGQQLGDLTLTIARMTGLGLMGYPTPAASLVLTAGVPTLVPLSLALGLNPPTGAIALVSNALQLPQLTDETDYWLINYRINLTNAASEGKFRADLFYDNGSGWTLLPLSKTQVTIPSSDEGGLGMAYRMRADVDATKIGLFLTCTTSRTITSIDAFVDAVSVGPVQNV